MKKFYYKIIALFTWLIPCINKLEYKNFNVKFKDYPLEIPTPALQKVNPSYVLIRNLEFSPEVNLNKMSDFKCLLKCRVFNLHHSVVLRHYKSEFCFSVKSLHRDELALKLPVKTLTLKKSDLTFSKKVGVNEEIVRISPYIKKKPDNILIELSVIKKPLDKTLLPIEAMRILKEKTAKQNNISRIEVEIFVIYDNFYPNLYNKVRQIPGSKNLECKFNFSAKYLNPKFTYYLVIGQNKKTGESIRAIVDPADIKKLGND